MHSLAFITNEFKILHFPLIPKNRTAWNHTVALFCTQIVEDRSCLHWYYLSLFHGKRIRQNWGYDSVIALPSSTKHSTIQSSDGIRRTIWEHIRQYKSTDIWKKSLLEIETVSYELSAGNAVDIKCKDVTYISIHLKGIHDKNTWNLKNLAE